MLEAEFSSALVARHLAMFSPLPPARSGVADYVSDLLSVLPSSWTVDVFGADEPGSDASGQLASEHARAGEKGPHRRRYAHREWARLHAERPYDLNIYQVGNNPLHAYALPYVTEHPGLLVLHDAVLHPSRASTAVDGGDLISYQLAASRARPEDGVGAALGELVAGGLGSPSMYWRFPLCEDLVRASRVTAIHGSVLAAWLRALVPESRVVEVAHWRRVPTGSVDRSDIVDPTASSASQDTATAGGGSDPAASSGDVVTIGSFGHVGAEHRLDLALEALAALRDRGRCRLRVVGGVDPALGLPELAEGLGIADRVDWVGYVPEHVFGAHLRSVDIALNLRYPSARASSGTLQQLMQLGVPVIVTDLLHLRDIPDAAVQRVPPAARADEVEALGVALRTWLDEPRLRQQASRAASDWARQAITPATMRQTYVEAVERAIESEPSSPRQAHQPERGVPPAAA